VTCALRTQGHAGPSPRGLARGHQSQGGKAVARAIVVIPDRPLQPKDKRSGGVLGRERMDQRVSGARVSSSTVEAFQALRTDAEVRFFEAQVGGISRLQLEATWPLEKYLDGILMEHRYVVKDIPRDLKSLYAQALAVALRLVRDFPDHPRAWALYLAMPFLCLQTCQGFRNTGPKMREMGLRLLRFIRGDIEALFAEAVELRQTNKERRLARICIPGALAQGSSWSDQAATLFREGKWSLAMQELEKNGGDLQRAWTPHAQAVIDQKLKRAALPSQDVAAVRASLREQKVKEYAVSPAELRSVMGRRNLNKGGGFSGHRFSHMASALRDEGSRSEVLSLAAEVVTIIMQGRAPMPLVPYLLGGVGNIAGEKRLFVAMEILVRLADAALQSKYLKDKGVGELFKFNLGVGIPGAADVLAAWLADMTRRHQHVEDFVFAELDAHNMFLEIDRVRLLQIVEERHPELYAVASYFTCKQFVTFFQGELVEEFSGGIPIGAGISSLLASLVEEVVLERLQEVHGQRILGIKAYIDNVFLALRAQDVRVVTDALRDIGRPYGLIYDFRATHPHKLHFPFACERITEWMECFSGWEITAAVGHLGVDKQGNFFAGVPVGSSAFLATVVEGAVDRAVRKLNLVLAAAPPQEAVALVQGCVISTLDYTRRTVHEVVAEHLWKRFDDAVVEGLERAMGGSGWQATPKVKQQLFLPGSMGGFSFRQFEGTAEAAILASYAAAFRHWGSSILEPVNFDLQVKNYNDQRVRRADRVEVGYTALMRRLTEIKKPQKLLSGLVRKLREEEFLLGLSKEQRVQIGAMKDPGAALYLTSVDWGTVLELQPGQRPYFSAEVFKYLFRRALVALKNPHGLDPALVSTCGRFFVTSGGTCSESMDLRLSHAESKCLGV